MCPTDTPRGGLRVLITRDGRRVERLRQALSARGARLEARPTIAFDPPDDRSRVDRAVDALERYSWIVVTSRTGAERLARAIAAHRGAADGGAARVAAVGPGTARELEQQGIRCAVVAAESRAEGLADALAGRIVRGERVLLVRPEVARSTLERALRARGARVDSVAFYKTVPAPEAAAVRDDLLSGRYDLAVFSSPSSLHALRDAGGPPGAVRDALRRIGIVAIGRTTAAALGEEGIEPDAIASRPTEEGLLEAIERAIPGRETHSPCATIRRPAAVNSARERGATGLAESHEPRRTPLYDLHVAAGGRMVDFAGWSLPLQFSGVIDEHLTVRRRVGLFDVSHMGEIVVRGRGALDFLQHATCNDVARLAPGRAQYTAITTPEGTFVDDLLIYRQDEREFLLVANAANTDGDRAWLEGLASDFDVELRDESAAWCQIAIQGPAAAATLAPLMDAEADRIRYYRFVEARVEGARCIVSRTGYTGEDGFEVYAPAEAGSRIWTALLDSGASAGIKPVGLAARDTLRLEAKMALYGNDIDRTTTVLEADLGWIVKPDKGPFVGREALVAQARDGVERKLVGFEMQGRTIARRGYPVVVDGKPRGSVTSGTRAPYLERNIGLAYLPAGHWDPGDRFEVEVRGRREAAVVVPTPFYRRERKPRSGAEE